MQLIAYFKKFFLLILVLSMLPAFARVEVDKIIVFGDSLSDNGNLYQLSVSAKKVIPLVPYIPKSPPYYQGRFTNGQVWVEHLADSLQVPLVNYAYGGAWAEGFSDSWLIIPPSLGMQVNMYSILPSTLTDFQMHKHLFVIWSGANDYLSNRADLEYATTNTVAAIQSQIDWLVRLGARKFVLINLPDLSKVPRAYRGSVDKAQKMQRLTTLHNQKLETLLKKLKGQYPHVNFLTIDMETLVNDAIANPQKHGIKNVMNACFTGGILLSLRNFATDPEVEAAKEAKLDIANNPVLADAFLNARAAEQGHSACPNPDEYLYWDQVHPTRVAHRFIGLLVALELAEQGVHGVQ